MEMKKHTIHTYTASQSRAIARVRLVEAVGFDAPPATWILCMCYILDTCVGTSAVPCSNTRVKLRKTQSTPSDRTCPLYVLAGCVCYQHPNIRMYMLTSHKDHHSARNEQNRNCFVLYLFAWCSQQLRYGSSAHTPHTPRSSRSESLTNVETLLRVPVQPPLVSAGSLAMWFPRRPASAASRPQQVVTVLMAISHLTIFQLTVPTRLQRAAHHQFKETSLSTSDIPMGRTPKETSGPANVASTLYGAPCSNLMRLLSQCGAPCRPECNETNHNSPASGCPKGMSGYARHIIIFTTAHSGVICGPASTPISSASAPDLYSSGLRGPR